MSSIFVVCGQVSGPEEKEISLYNAQRHSFLDKQAEYSSRLGPPSRIWIFYGTPSNPLEGKRWAKLKRLCVKKGFKCLDDGCDDENRSHQKNNHGR